MKEMSKEWNDSRIYFYRFGQHTHDPNYPATKNDIVPNSISFDLVSFAHQL